MSFCMACGGFMQETNEYCWTPNGGDGTGRYFKCNGCGMKLMYVGLSCLDPKIWTSKGKRINSIKKRGKKK